MSENQPRSISRRTVTAGVAWSVPVVAAATAAPALAASSPDVPTGSICRLFYGGGTVNYQVHSIYLGVRTQSGVIPAGTTISWTVTAPNGGMSAPTTNYDSAGQWTLSVSGSNPITATIVFHTDYNTGLGSGGGEWCAPALVWTDSNFTIRPRTRLVVDSGTGSLTYDVARRHPDSVNTTGRSPHVYYSKTGDQLCYPGIQWSRRLRDGYDNVTTYPQGTTVPTPCTWGTTRCDGTSGLSTPRSTQVVNNGQYQTMPIC